MSHFQSLSAYRRSQPVRVTPPLHREIHENDLILGAKQFITCRFLSDQGKTAVNTVVFTRILTMSRRKYTAINQLGFNSLHPKFCVWVEISWCPKVSWMTLILIPASHIRVKSVCQCEWQVKWGTLFELNNRQGAVTLSISLSFWMSQITISLSSFS